MGHWFKKNRKLLIWAIVALLFLGNLWLVLDPNSTADPGVQTDIQEKYSFWQNFRRQIQSTFRSGAVKYSQLDGQLIDPAFQEQVVSVMMDNIASTWDQHSGINSASVVYESLVEGGITRMMLIFPYQETELVGPVRSARDYFVDWASEYGGIYVHAGGSPSAMDKLMMTNRLFNLEEDDRAIAEPYSYRDSRYQAPHDLYFDLLLTRERVASLTNHLQSPTPNWCFSENRFDTEREVSRVDLDFPNDSNSRYYVQFHYDSWSKRFTRYHGSGVGQVHIDQLDGKPVSPRNLIVQVVPAHLIEGDEKERLSMDNVGQGSAFFYSQGYQLEGHWQKNSPASPTVFTDSGGNSICLIPGQTWVAIVSDEDLILEYPE